MRVIFITAFSLFITSQTLYAITMPVPNVNPPIVTKTDKNVKIDLNKADVNILIHSYKGIGKKRAEAIIQYRQTKKFNSVEDLNNVKGFGKKFVRKNWTRLNQIFTAN